MKIQIKENIPLVDYTTFHIGGPAKYFFEAKTAEDLKEALLWAKEKGVLYFVMGGGSNLLVSDDGFNGLVIKVTSDKWQVASNKIIADAGVPLAKLVIESVDNNLTGLEWAVGIPGTIGGAICGNAGAYGHSISESITRAKVIDENGKMIDFNKKDFQFRYRGSIFKKKDNKLIINNVELALKDGDGGGRKKIKEIIAARRSKIPPFPSAGSFFTNYVLEKSNPSGDPLIKNHPELKAARRSGKIGMGYLIEQCGLKGKISGGAKIADEHANFIVNTGGAKAKDVLELVKICKEKVKEKFDVDLEEETRYVGF